MNTLKLIFLSAITSSGIFSAYPQSISADGRSSNETALHLPKAKINAGEKPSYSKIELRVFNNFQKTYKDVPNPVWESHKEGYSATFTKDNTRHLVVYNRKGHWLHSIMTYDEKKLPKEERNMVRSNYFDHRITHVKEIHDARVSYPIYLVGIEDDSEIKILRLAEGEMETYQQFRKK